LRLPQEPTAAATAAANQEPLLLLLDVIHGHLLLLLLLCKHNCLCFAAKGAGAANDTALLAAEGASVPWQRLLLLLPSAAGVLQSH
jgi:hypothetical protein